MVKKIRIEFLPSWGRQGLTGTGHVRTLKGDVNMLYILVVVWDTQMYYMSKFSECVIKTVHFIVYKCILKEKSQQILISS